GGKGRERSDVGQSREDRRALFGWLEGAGPSRMVTLNRAVALGMAHGPAEGLALLDTLSDDERVAGHHRYFAVRAHLLELAGEPAREDYLEAARRTTSRPERRYLEERAASPSPRSRR